ncbi:hypothetical protein KOR42_21380 [Thalassoglobus neptunius]|uniref:DUF11 domain-containing protein n=1 Tax=Thalassoglobus neptunius TaxID=1938619 RepID=A0A5C5XA62_9PLAN|nr:DUF11 domain-containing protein [Thalassoglobus neptunius]TWT58752.1 hypothetical protein KOR42_21380 [Thalassoglobus neptunius]
MRRSACLLAILGLGISSANAQSSFGPSVEANKPAPGGLQFFNSKSDQTTPSAEAPGPRPVKIEEASPIPGFYGQAIGGAAQKNEAKAEPARPTFTFETTVDASAGSGVTPATFQAEESDSSPTIQPVSGELGDVRPFPGKPASAEAPAPETPAPMTAADGQEEMGVPAKTTPKGSFTITRAPDRKEKAARSLTAPVAPNTFGTPSVVTGRDLHGPQTPSLTIEWKTNSEINVGQQFDCDLVISNHGKSTATRVEVQARLPQNIRVVNTEPKPDQSETFLGWEFAELKPGQQKTIKVSMIPFQRGAINADASVRFSGNARGVFEVAEPMLALKLTGPQEVHVGDSVPHSVIVTNPGTGVAKNVRVEAFIPKGLEHIRGERLLMEIGSLNPGESRHVQLAMSAVAGGTHDVMVHAVADNGLDEQISSAVHVIAPNLMAEVSGPRLRYLGREGTFKLTVKNDGQAATNNVQLMHKIPDGFKFVSADRGVQFDRNAKMLIWFVGRLDVKQSAELNVTLMAEKSGAFKHLIRATSEHGTLADAELDCRIEGASSLSVAVIDLDDPVEVGTEAVYEVQVKNEGTAAAKDVGLTCELAPGTAFVHAEGPAAHVSEGNEVVFRTTPELAPGETATFRVRVASKTPGNMRFRARVTSESVPEPLTTDELTKFYGE